MLLLKGLLLFGILNTSDSACTMTSWDILLREVGQYMCDSSDLYIRGFERVDKKGEEDYIDNIKRVQCCSASPQWSNIENQVVYPHWMYELDRTNVWAYCPAGYFLQGLYKSSWGNLGNIEGARCTKPSSHPSYYGNCYVKNTTSCFDARGLCSCKEDYFVTGLYKSSCDHLNCLDALRCCQMAETTEIIDDTSAIKTKIMDTTLMNMANLANMLGYDWCKGCNGKNIGEDFYRDGNTWIANRDVFYEGNCDGYKNDHRLSLDFSDWSFEVKKIDYGQSVVEQLARQSTNTGIIYNKDAAPLTEDFEFKETVESTITHSTTSSWTDTQELGISLNLEIPLIGGGTSLTYNTRFEHSSTILNETSTKQGKEFTKHSSKTLAPYSAVRYNVTVSKVRITTPYTATIISRFSTEFRGFLRWGQGLGSPTTNYHYTHKGSESRPTFNYRFGDGSNPFYTTLKKQVKHQSRPWLWQEMMNNYPQASHLINRLTDEGMYEFTLTGKLEQVYGTKIDVVWETVNYTRRDEFSALLPVGKVISGTYIATSGPEDRPAQVVYPTVSLVNSEPFRIEATPVYTNST